MSNATRLIAELNAQVAAGAVCPEIGYDVRGGDGFVATNGCNILVLPLSRAERAELQTFIDGPDGFAADEEAA